MRILREKDNPLWAEVIPNLKRLGEVIESEIDLEDKPSSVKEVSLEEAKKLMAQGWQGADLHVHTIYSCDVLPTWEVDPLVLYEKGKQRGMSFISFTDHDTMEAYERVGWTRERIVPGVEVKIFDPKRVGHTVHLNIYTLNKKQFKEIEKIAQMAQDIEMLISYLKEENLPFVYNHPFWHEVGEKLNSMAVVNLAEMCPVLEYNLGRIRKLNRLMLKLAQKQGKAVVAGSDSHTGDIGRIFTLAQGKDFKEFFNSIKNGRAILVTEDLTYVRIKDEIWRRLEMLLDNQRWVMTKKALSLTTGNALVDGLIKGLADGGNEILSLKKIFLSLIAKVISLSGIPANLYLWKQNLLANQIQQELAALL